MSQIASFTFIKESDIPFLGFWSKPKPRLFRRPESRFDELLGRHAIRKSFFEDADGIYVALVFAWLESQDRKFTAEADPVLQTLRKQLSGSHWLVTCADVQLSSLLEKPFLESEWFTFLRNVGIDDRNRYVWAFFDSARRFVRKQLSQMKIAEAVLVSVG